MRAYEDQLNETLRDMVSGLLLMRYHDYQNLSMSRSPAKTTSGYAKLVRTHPTIMDGRYPAGVSIELTTIADAAAYLGNINCKRWPSGSLK